MEDLLELLNPQQQKEWRRLLSLHWFWRPRLRQNGVLTYRIALPDRVLVAALPHLAVTFPTKPAREKRKRVESSLYCHPRDNGGHLSLVCGRILRREATAAVDQNL
jgi:hypothetical protein